MKRTALLFFLLTGFVPEIHAQTQPAASSGTKLTGAAALMQDAYATAAKENKQVFVMFHASWCGWCHKMDASMNDAACSKFFASNFVVVHMVVDESKDKKDKETPGADEMRTQYHGEGQGIPFWLVFDSKGKLVADSKLRKPSDTNDMGENVGCPASAAEVDYFIEVLKKCTSITSEQETAIRERFRRNEVK